MFIPSTRLEDRTVRIRSFPPFSGFFKYGLVERIDFFFILRIYHKYDENEIDLVTIENVVLNVKNKKSRKIRFQYLTIDTNAMLEK